MRKWMRERMKRRKKTEPGDRTPKEASQDAPLQPAYFDAESPSESPQPAALESEANERDTVEAPSDRELPAEDQSLAKAGEAPEGGASPAKEPPRRRRRRGRGGRGRTQASRPAPAPLQPTLLTQPDAASATAKAPEAGTDSPAQRAHKGVVVLAIGLPGSGKSSWFKRHNIRALSSDLVRQLLFDDPNEQRYQDLVFSNLRSMLKARMIARRPTNYVDATNLTPHDRHTWIKLARDYGYEVNAVFFDVPLEVCMERNQRRHRVVPEDAMRRMAAKFRPPTFEEGFSKITVVRVRKKEAAT
jgi:predicted kinase